MQATLLYRCSGDSNSGHHPCTASTLPMDPSPQSTLPFLYLVLRRNTIRLDMCVCLALQGKHREKGRVMLFCSHKQPKMLNYTHFFLPMVYALLQVCYNTPPCFLISRKQVEEMVPIQYVLFFRHRERQDKVHTPSADAITSVHWSK